MFQLPTKMNQIFLILSLVDKQSLEPLDWTLRLAKNGKRGPLESWRMVVQLFCRMNWGVITSPQIIRHVLGHLILDRPLRLLRLSRKTSRTERGAIYL